MGENYATTRDKNFFCNTAAGFCQCGQPPQQVIMESKLYLKDGGSETRTCPPGNQQDRKDALAPGEPFAEHLCYIREAWRCNKDFIRKFERTEIPRITTPSIDASNGGSPYGYGWGNDANGQLICGPPPLCKALDAGYSIATMNNPPQSVDALHYRTTGCRLQTYCRDGVPPPECFKIINGTDEYYYEREVRRRVF